MPSHRSIRRLFGPSMAIAVALLVFAPAVAADSAVVTKGGTLYEVAPDRYGNVVAGAAGTADANTPILVLRTTDSDGATHTEIVEGTFDRNEEGSHSIEYDEATGTVFVIYCKFQGLMSDMHVAVRRDGQWIEQDILPSLGLYMSINPRAVVTRQTYKDFGPGGFGSVTKTRTILSLIWWEESGSSQARYAAVFVEDGVLRIDDIIAYNLNELAGSSGVTTLANLLPTSAYSFPAVERDPTSNGGVLVSFADLAADQQVVLKITFPDDITKLPPPDASTPNRNLYARSHVPIGRRLGDGRIFRQLSTPNDVGAHITQSGLTTLYWQDGSSVKFLRSDAAVETPAKSIPLRGDISRERAVRLIRDMSEKD